MVVTPATMDYRYFPFPGNFGHCIWINNSDRSGPDSPEGQGERRGWLAVDRYERVTLSPLLQQWMKASIPRDRYKLSGHGRMGLAIRFDRQSDAMLFKLAHGGS